ncbi:MAG: NADH-quinone oxidoreductase subunit NuoE [Actinobacteria bacterium]|nr:NADH-quinone oxidoreductase subunit NuoE [Actinomycetota bacterium]MCL6094573.1 NADH-quinone oxidoreductase subunit NuoE [Actinomycetota bacterium]
MGHFNSEVLQRAKELIALYPHPRSALIPLCHLAQEQDGWLTPEAIEEIAQLLDISPAEVAGTASFYDMFHRKPVGRYLISVCTNIACMLSGGRELLQHVSQRLGVAVGGTTADGMFTLEEAECLADCGSAPVVQVNHRFFSAMTPDSVDQLVEDLAAGKLSDVVPPHGVLNRVKREVGLQVPVEELVRQRREASQAREERARLAQQGQEGRS